MAPQSYQLVERSGPNPGKVFPLNKNEIYIGRDANNDVVISDAEVSRKHCRMVLQAGGYVLEDLGSTNGTFVNGQRLMGPHLLRPGELVMLGENVSMTFEAGFDADATQVSAPAPVSVFPQPELARPSYEPPPSRPVTQPPPTPAAQPPFTGQIPEGPPEPYYEPVPEERRSNRTLIYAGCGCLLVLACLILVGAYAFDSMNLYCTPLFRSFFACP